MHDGGDRIYRLHVIIHNRLFTECEVLDNVQGQGLVVRGQGQGQGLVNWSLRILEDRDFPRGQQHWPQNSECH